MSKLACPIGGKPNKPYREITPEAVFFGILIGSAMTAAFVYVALRLGFTLPGSTVAAILGFGVLRGLLKKGTIIENNINQTVASGINNASAGIAFTLPALFILQLEDPTLLFSPIPILMAAIAGSFLGIVVIIPLRKQMIEFERLRFPSGIAVATLLKSPGAGAKQAKLLLIGFAIAAPFHLLISELIHEIAPAIAIAENLSLNGLLSIPIYIPVAATISFASLGAGLLSGKGGLPFFFGGVLAWWIIMPIVVSAGWVPGQETLLMTLTQAEYQEFLAWDVGYYGMLRPIGIGILIGGAISGVIASFPALKAAIKGLTSTKNAGVSSDELPAKVLYFGIAASFAVLFATAILADPTINPFRAFIVAVVGTIWLALAGLIVAQAAGMTDISPISGMTLIGVTLMFFLSGGNPITAIVLGVAVSIGIGQCSDMMSDLKSGHLIGAIPRKQQLVQFAVSWIGVPVAIGVIYLLWDGGMGFGPNNPNLSAPQGSALAGIIGSLQQGAAPLDKYISGAAVGLGLGAFPLSGLGVLVGLAMYLPFPITVTYGIGCFSSIGLEKKFGSKWIGNTLVPIAAGFIIGEALTSLSSVIIQLIIG